MSGLIVQEMLELADVSTATRSQWPPGVSDLLRMSLFKFRINLRDGTVTFDHVALEKKCFKVQNGYFMYFYATFGTLNLIALTFFLFVYFFF